MEDTHPHHQICEHFPPYPPCVSERPVGIGLRSPHYEQLIEKSPDTIGWLEIHPENYFCGGIHKNFLDQISGKYKLSMHGVGLSLGADQAVNKEHLRAFKVLIDLYDPFIVSDHIAWSASGNAHLNDLLPLPYTQQTLGRLQDNINQTQDFLGRRILVENPSTYIAFIDNDMPEHDFMNQVAEKTGCGILLDINNIYVQSHNHGLNPHHYIDHIDIKHVGEMHLAGHITKDVGAHSLLIDTHNQPVCDAVWALYDYTMQKVMRDKGTIIPTLIEWDQDFPPLQTLLNEATAAHKIITQHIVKEPKHATV